MSLWPTKDKNNGLGAYKYVSGVHKSLPEFYIRNHYLESHDIYQNIRMMH